MTSDQTAFYGCTWNTLFNIFVCFVYNYELQTHPLQDKSPPVFFATRTYTPVVLPPGTNPLLTFSYPGHIPSRLYMCHMCYENKIKINDAALCLFIGFKHLKRHVSAKTNENITWQNHLF